LTGLLGSAMLEAVIGLAFLYFLLSLICSAINEMIASLTKMRAKYLKSGIENLLCDPVLAKQVLEHPLIKSGETPGNMPSYVPSRIFTLALYDELLDAKTEPVTDEAIRRKALEYARATDKNAQKMGKALLRLTDTAYVPDPKQAMEMVDRVREALKDLPAARPHRLEIEAAQTVAEVRAIVMKLQDPNLRQSILSYLDMQEAKLQAVSANIAQWFDNAMDRVSGVYKRRVQFFVLGISLLVTVVLGVDSIAIFNSLSTAPSLRTLVMAQAEQAVAKSAPGTEDIKAQPAYQSLVALHLPIGYADLPALDAPGGLSWWISKIAGMLITIFAVSMGAPFWFDVLSKLVNMRAAGTRPAKAGEGDGA